MKLKFVVAVALIVFILVVGNILAIGLLQPKSITAAKENTPLKSVSDLNTNIEVNKSKPNTVQPTPQTTDTATKPATQPSTTTSVTAPAPTKTTKTRAS